VDEFFDHTTMIDLQYEVITGMSGFSQAQIMLSLALLSYRGFWNPGSDNRQGMAGAVTEGLDQLEPLKGDWVLVWGPGTYRYLGSVFDSSMMYVVQHRKEVGRYAIVVRGTNPVALFDWMLGDFLSHRQVPWHHCSSGVAPQASLSLSTALGLKILLNMRAGPGTGDIVEAGKFSSLLDLGMRVLSTAKGAGDAGLATAGEAVNSTAADVVQEGATRLIEGLQKYQGQWSFADKIADAVISAIGNLLPLDDVADRVSFRQQLVSLLDASFEAVADDAPVAMLMPSPEELSQDQPPGIGLLELLGNLAARHGDSLELFVTGHSKGGALAPALALFLSDTQNCEEIYVPGHYQWNPHGKATIQCYSFAGPTPGNTAFAGYFNDQLGRHFYRYANKLDLVTLAWQSEELRKTGEIFGEAISAPPGLSTLFKQMADEVADIDYCHLGQDYLVPGAINNQTEKHVVEFSRSLREQNSSYLSQAIHQHVGGYIDVLGLDRFFDLQELVGLRSGS
jgi:hypothetical protein